MCKRTRNSQTASDDREQITATVHSFYRDLPFNYYASTASAEKHLHSTNAVASSYPDLHRLLHSGEIKSVVEFGCGAGWLTNTIAYHYRLPVEAVDFTTKAVRRAKRVAQALNVADLVSITQADLFEYPPRSSPSSPMMSDRKSGVTMAFSSSEP